MTVSLKAWSESNSRPLDKTKRIRGSSWQVLRHRVLARDPLCVSCASRGAVKEAMEVDHINRLEFGGDNSLANLQGLCVDCHKAKTKAEARPMEGYEPITKALMRSGWPPIAAR